MKTILMIGSLIVLGTFLVSCGSTVATEEKVYTTHENGVTKKVTTTKELEETR
jgi:hypothetical protein